MWVTAFHLANKTEEAVMHYLREDSPYAGSNFETQRTVDFRKNTCSTHYFRSLEEDEEYELLGSLFIETIQEGLDKTAFQCQLHYTPENREQRFFILVNTDGSASMAVYEILQQIQRLWGGAARTLKTEEEDEDLSSILVSEDDDTAPSVDIDALIAGEQETDVTPSAVEEDVAPEPQETPQPTAKTVNKDEPVELSAEEIWQQISGGGSKE